MIKKIEATENLKDYILEWRDMLGHELKVGDWVEFQSGGIGLWGEIEEITDEEKQKYVIKTMGWFGDKSCYLYGKYYCDSCYNIVSEAEKLGHAPYNNSLNEKVVVLEDNLKKLEEKLNKLKG